MHTRFAFFAYRSLVYLVYLAAFCYALAFVSGLVEPAHLEGVPRRPIAVTLAIDLVLLSVSAVLAHIVVAAQFERREIERPYGGPRVARPAALPMLVADRVAHAAAITARHSIGALLLAALAALPATAQDWSGRHAPAVPSDIEVEAGHEPRVVSPTRRNAARRRASARRYSSRTRQITCSIDERTRPDARGCG